MLTCRFCKEPLRQTFVDLGLSPLSNDYVTEEQISRGQHFFPLHARVCESCFLVQLEQFEAPDAIFNDYAYFSSFSTSWLEHAKAYVEKVAGRFQLNAESQVIEIASNDGYLLQYFQGKHIPVLGIEPAANVAQAAMDKGIPTRIEFFSQRLAKNMVAEGIQADMLIANNVLAHVPDLNDFVAGLKIILKHDGVMTLEFPHLLRLIENNQFDTIYHEHFSYFSLLTVEKVFAAHGLMVFDVEELATHGGSLRVYVCHVEREGVKSSEALIFLRQLEQAARMNDLQTYTQFSQHVQSTKRELLRFLIEAKTQGKSVVGYGAPAKGNTLLNFCGICTDFIDFTVDRNPRKQGRFLPGSLIPIYAPEKIFEAKPDYVLILPWNIQCEIMQQMAEIREWGGQFVVPIPKVEICCFDA